MLRWYQNVQRGSEVTADVYLRRLGHFCTTNHLEPASLLRLDEKALSDILLDNVTKEMEVSVGPDEAEQRADDEDSMVDE